jgi:hypothetical protein
MSLTVQNIIDAARYRHAKWRGLTQPHGPILQHMDLVQTELFNEALAYDPKFMAQRLGILVKASTFADFPGTLSGTSPAIDTSPTGDLLELDKSSELDEGVPSDATVTTLIDSSKSWTINAYAGKYVRIDFGVGADQIRLILSNTATSLIIDTDDPFTTVPTTASHYEIIEADLEAQDDLKLTKGIRPEGKQIGYAVKYDYTTKTPYIATDEPLTVKFQEGIQLPELQRVIGMTIYRGDRGELEAAVVDYNLRYQPPRRPATYILNRTMYLIDPMVDWRENDQIELWYVPVPPALDELTDIFLLPDAAKPYLVWEACTVLEDLRPTGKDWEMKAMKAKETFFRSQVGKIGISRVKEVW